MTDSSYITPEDLENAVFRLNNEQMEGYFPKLNETFEVQPLDTDHVVLVDEYGVTHGALGFKGGMFVVANEVLEEGWGQ